MKLACKCCKEYTESEVYGSTRYEFHLMARLSTNLRCKKCKCIPRIIFYKDAVRMHRWNNWTVTRNIINFLWKIKCRKL